MRRLFLITSLMASLSAVAAVANDDPAYHLGVGDQVRVKVFEWRSSVGDVHEWSALNADYRVGVDGAVSLPLLGLVKASGLTVEQLAEAISGALQNSVKLAARPQTSVEVVQYRPFYILGDVNKAGEYPYRPGLTVLQAISLAGGKYRINDTGLLLNALGDVRVLRLQYNALLARRTRLQAELDEAANVTFPPELLRQQKEANIASLIQREQTMFTTRRTAVRAELDALNQLKSLLNAEIVSLQAKMKNVDQELALLQQELKNTSALVQQGLAIAPREFTLRQTSLEAQDRRLDLDTAVLRARESIGRADQSIIELRNKSRNDIQTELAEVERKLPETAAKIANSMMIANPETDQVANAFVGSSDAAMRYVILRPKGGAVKNIIADESTPVEPGDTIKVLRTAEETPFSIGQSAGEDAPGERTGVKPTAK